MRVVLSIGVSTLAPCALNKLAFVSFANVILLYKVNMRMSGRRVLYQCEMPACALDAAPMPCGPVPQ